MGAGTGRGLGICSMRGAGSARESGASKDRGFRIRFGAFFGGRGGRGRRNRFFATGVSGWQYVAGNPIPGGMPFPTPSETPQNELDALKGQAQYLENGLKEIQARMEVLASRNESE